jgi:hypothetical protein
METTAPQLQGEHMTPEQTLDWLAEQHKSQCNEDRPVQEWIRSMKSMLPAPTVQEPVAWIWKYANGEEEVVFVPPRHVDATHVDAPSTITPLYTTPPAAQRQWVGLTAAERKEIERLSVYVEGAIRFTEAKLKEKNT